MSVLPSVLIVCESYTYTCLLYTSYPFGFKTDTMVDVLSKHGYQLAFTTKHDFVHPGDNPLEVSRIIIWPETTLVQFEQRITPKPSH